MRGEKSGTSERFVSGKLGIKRRGTAWVYCERMWRKWIRSGAAVGEEESLRAVRN